MGTMRIGDIPGLTAEDRTRLEAVANVVEGVAKDAVAAGLVGIPDIVNRAVEAALQKEREARLPAADPRAQAIACTREILAGIRGNVPASARMPEILGKFRGLFPADMADEDILRATLTTASTGMSYVLPTPVADEIQVYAREPFPILALLRQWPVAPGQGISGSIPVGSSTRCTTYITSQATAPTDSAPQPGTFAYTLLRFATGVPMSNQLYDLSVPAFAAWINAEVGYAHGLKQHQQFAVGTNSTQWMGLESASLSQVTTTSSLEADLIALLYLTVPAMHRVRGVFCCNDTTLAAIWNLKDGDGRRIVTFAEEKLQMFGRLILTNAAFTDGNLFFGDPTRYIRSHGRLMTAAVGFGQGYTMTAQDSTYIYMGEDLDGGVSDTNGWRYCVLTV
ncbi:phage major capsid protein [candidate division WOR-3 bacterium]|nr:phage major capsid protein [candidate division WOR-3 bacterium]